MLQANHGMPNCLIVAALRFYHDQLSSWVDDGCGIFTPEDIDSRGCVLVLASGNVGLQPATNESGSDYSNDAFCSEVVRAWRQSDNCSRRETPRLAPVHSDG